MRTAEVGDWIVGTGSTRWGFQNKVVYAMEVTQKMTMEEYNQYCLTEFPEKIPSKGKDGYRNLVGDCIYDFSESPPTLRSNLHNKGNRPIDLGGKYALLSDNFYYFGKDAVDLPIHLLPIVKQGQGHKSKSATPFLGSFVEWITQFNSERNPENPEPFLKLDFLKVGDNVSFCGKLRCKKNQKDEKIAAKKSARQKDIC